MKRSTLRLCSKDFLYECLEGLAVGGRDEVTSVCRNQLPPMLPENAARPNITTPLLMRDRVHVEDPAQRGCVERQAILAVMECSR